jgi:hypothetical protein
MNKMFKIKDLGIPTKILGCGIAVAEDNKKIQIHQSGLRLRQGAYCYSLSFDSTC